MNPKNTFFLVALAAALFAFIFFVERRFPRTDSGPVNMLPSFRPKAVTTVRVALAGQPEIRVERTNDGWELTKPLLYPAQSDAVDKLLNAVAGLTPQTRISAQELKGKLSVDEEYGFDNAQATLVFQQSGEPRTLKLGRFTAPGDQIYAQVVGMDGVAIIEADFFKTLVPHQPNDWRETAIVNFQDRPFDALTVFANGAQAFELRRESASQPWRMTKPRVTRANSSKVNTLLSELEKLRVTRFVSDDPLADLESYGLKPAGLELRLDRGTNPVFSVQFGKSPTNDPALIHARCNGQPTIVLVPREFISPWEAGYQEFRDHHLIRLAAGPPDVIEVRGTENFTIERKTNDTWRITEPFDFPASTRLMNAFLGKLTSLEVVRGNNGVAVSDTVLDSDLLAYGLVQPGRQYLLKKNPAGATTNALNAELDFGLARDGIIYARRGDRPDETSVYAVKLDDFRDLPERALDLRERRIWNFIEDDVASITIRQNGEEHQLAHKGPHVWSVASGSAIINPLQIEMGAQELGMLEAGRWVSRGDQDRAKYGFTEKSPQMLINLNAKGRAQTYVLALSNLSASGIRYGEVQLDDGQKWIFEFPESVAEQLSAWFRLQ